MGYRKILYLMMALLTAACSSSEDAAPQEDSGIVPVAFGATMAGAPTAQARSITRTSTTAINSNKDLSDRGGFGVFGCNTGLYKYVDSNVRPNFMYNEHVESTDDGANWTYSPLKYWPNGEDEVTGLTGANPHYVSFFAYAPWSDCSTGDTGYCIPSFSHQGDMGNPWLTYRLHTNVSNQVDLLCARPLLDQTKPSSGEKLLFVFNHALACVGNEVTINCSDALKSQIRGRVNGSTITKAKVEVTALSIEYTLTAKARLVFWNQGEMNWQAIFSEDPICTRTVTFLESELTGDDQTIHEYDGTNTTNNPITKEGQGVYYIPAEFKGYQQTAVVSLTYRIATYNGSSWTYDSTITGTATITLSSYPEAFQPGKHLYINVTLNPMDIELTAAIAPWEVVGPVVIDGIEE